MNVACSQNLPFSSYWWYFHSFCLLWSHGWGKQWWKKSWAYILACWQ